MAIIFRDGSTYLQYRGFVHRTGCLITLEHIVLLVSWLFFYLFLNVDKKILVSFCVYMFKASQDGKNYVSNSVLYKRVERDLFIMHLDNNILLLLQDPTVTHLRLAFNYYFSQFIASLIVTVTAVKSGQLNQHIQDFTVVLHCYLHLPMNIHTPIFTLLLNSYPLYSL